MQELKLKKTSTRKKVEGSVHAPGIGREVLDITSKA